MKYNIIRLIKMMIKFRKQHLFAMFFMILSSLLALVPPYLTMKMVDEAIIKGDIVLLARFALMALAATLLQGGSKLISDYLYAFIGKRIMVALRYKILNHLQKLSGSYYSNAKSGELLTKIQIDLSRIEDVATRMLFSVVSELCLSISMLIFLIYLQYDLLIISLILQPFMVFLQVKFNKRSSALFKDSRNTIGELLNLIRDLLSGLMQFTAILNAQKYFYKKYFDIEKKYIKQSIGIEMLFSWNIVGMNLISILSTIIVLGYGGYKVILGTLTIGGLIAFNLYSQKLFSPIMKIAQFSLKIQEAKVSIDRIFEILDEPIEITQNNKGFVPANIIGNIEFCNVSFNYLAQQDLLKDLNMNFEAGKTTAIVGSSGVGKTTIVNLLLRLWDVQNGTIFLDGRNIKEYNLKFLRKSISVVSQEAFLFDDTIYNNIVVSNTKATMDEVVQATKIANIYEFIQSLPDQFETNVGERGVKLSGGQKQRISIARAVLRKSNIIVLDEATSSLDNLSERIFQDNLKEYLEDKTTIIIAHRLSTIETANKIYVLNKGRVTESGTHETLINLKGIYYNLYLNGTKQ